MPRRFPVVPRMGKSLSPFYGRKAIEPTPPKVGHRGEPCHQGWTAQNTGCVPASGEGSGKLSNDKKSSPRDKWVAEKLKAKCTIQEKDKFMLRKMFDTADESIVASLVGAPDDATVNITLDGRKLHVETNHPDYDFPQVRKFFWDDNEVLYVDNVYFGLKEEARGWGWWFSGAR